MCKKTNTEELVDAIFDEFKSKQKYKEALRRAAEYVWRAEMEDTNDKMTDVLEFAEQYGHYESEQEKERALKNCIWESKDEYISALIESWINPDPTEDW